MEWRPAGWSVSASVNLPLHPKVQKFSSGTGSPGWSRKKGRRMFVVGLWLILKDIDPITCSDKETVTKEKNRKNKSAPRLSAV